MNTAIIAFEKGNSFSAKVIKYITKSKYSHCELIIDNKWISSDPKVGGAYVNDLRPLTDKYDYITVYVDGATKRKALGFANNQVGKKYDWCGVLCTHLFKIDRENNDKWFCSELVCTLLQKMENPQVKGAKPADLTPQDLYEIFRGV